MVRSIGMVVVLGLLCGILSGCAQAVYYGLQAAGAAAGASKEIGEKKKTDAEALCSKAKGHLGRGELALAEESIQGAMNLWPEHNQYRIFLAGLYYEMAIKKDNPEYFRKSNAAFLSTLKGNEKNSPLLNGIAWNYFMLGEDADRGIGYIKQAIELDGRRCEYVGTYGCLFLLKGNYAEAKALLKEAVDKSKSENQRDQFSTDLYYLALAHYKIGEKDQAADYLKQAIETDPARYDRKRVEAQMGKNL